MVECRIASWILSCITRSSEEIFPKLVIKECQMICLVLDDNEIVRKVLSKHVVSSGNCCVTCRDADTAYQVFEDNKITHMFVDIYLDRYLGKIKDGLEFIRLVRSYERDSMIDDPVYIAAFSSDNSTEGDAIKAGADSFLRKPISAQVVLDIMRGNY